MKISYPGLYQGYDTESYDSYERHSVYVAMRDGTKLALDYLIPAKGGLVQKGPFPVVLEFTPYNRVNHGSGLKEIDLESYEYDATENNAYVMTNHGYVYAKADVRGTGASYGTRTVPNNDQECMDGYDLVEWLAIQPFSNGCVGMIGSSYTGQTQIETMKYNPPHLKAVCIGNTNFDTFDGWYRGCGILSDFGEEDEEKLLGKERGKTIADRVFETVPVDNDQNAQQLREAIVEQESGGLWTHLFEDLAYRDSISKYTNGPYLEDISPSNYLERLNHSGIAVYLLSGMYDPYRRDAFIMMKNLKLPIKMTMGSWYHCLSKNNPDWPVEQVRWFDYWLKEIDNGIMSEPPFFLKCENDDEQSDFHKDWPVNGGLKRTVKLASKRQKSESEAGTFVLLKNDSKAICLNEEEDQKIQYQSIYGIQTSIEDYSAEDMEKKGIVFESEVYREGIKITGHPMLHLSFESIESEDLDFYIILSDFDPESGISHIFTDGRLRASFRKTGVPHYDFLGLPWHTGIEKDIEPLTTGEKYSVDIDLMPVNYQVLKGHKLRLTISNSMSCFDYIGKKSFKKYGKEKGEKWNLILSGTLETTLTLPDIYNQ